MRPFLIWRDDWLLGNELMDAQHLLLASNMNELHRFLAHDGRKQHAGMDQLLQRLSDLLEMTKRHFQDEEALMQDHGYHRLSEHHREHALLLAEMQECIREIESGNRPFTLKTLTALKHWQIDHVLNSDRDFASYLNRISDQFQCSLTERQASLSSQM
jgi:hemerythrin